MSTIHVIYYSGTGNTEAMAEAVKKGIESSGKAADLVSIGDATEDMVTESDAIAFGCPAMGAEVLEESEFDPFFTSIEGALAGKKVALFGSYGWGNGEWMRDWEDRVRAAGADLVNDEGVICLDAPEEDTLAKLEKLGAALQANPKSMKRRFPL